MIHVKTFGPGGSYPKAVCGFRGGTKGRMVFTSARMIALHADACPDCVRRVT